MTSENKKIEEFIRSPDEIFAFYNIIRVLRGVKEFREWSKEYHEIKNDQNLFEGFKFLLDVCIRKFIDSIIMDSSLDIKEDFTFFRARFVGIPIEDIPNTCDKVVLLKNLSVYLKIIKKSHNWNELEINIKKFTKEVLSIFSKILKNQVDVNKKFSGKTKEDILKIISMFYAYIFLIDNWRGLPKGYYVSILKETLNSKYMDKAFEGYKIGLQFLWYKILGNKFEKSCLKDFHNAEKNAKVEDLIDPFEKELIDRNKKSLKNHEFATVLKWRSIDRFFGKIQDEIIIPIEEELDVKFGFEKLFIIKNKVDKKVFGELLSKIPEEPEYLNKYDKESIKKQLDYLLFWYPYVEVLDTQKSLIFNGVPAFVSTFIGAVEIKRKLEVNDSIYVLRFKHPVPEVKGNDYSYGVLIEAYGSIGISDYSGWLIFYDCCGDYSGFAGSEHAFAEMFIKKYQTEGLIDVREFQVKKEIFQEYLAEKSVRDFSIKKLVKEKEIKLKINSALNKFENYISDISGKFFESIVLYYLHKKGFVEVQWCLPNQNGPIDIFAKSGDTLYFIECTVSLDQNYLKKAEKLSKKVLSISGDKNSEKHMILYVWNDVDPSRKKQIEENFGIEVKPNFKNEIFLRDRIFTKVSERDKVNQILSRQIIELVKKELDDILTK
ncbi:MAG: hypothetical protein J7J38_00420 [Candidatus Aenigmarchaeota archaeon]|nr:hypothetical protein [Candidatus Aenigmarchaeota archaeon]